MLSKGINMALAMMVVMAMSMARTMAQSSCTNVLISLAPCLNYVTGSASTPTSSCCSQLASVVQRQPRCLCLILNGGGASFGVSINQTLALALPGACNVVTPPVSKCNGNQSPSGSPEGSPGSDTNPLTSESSSIVMNIPINMALLVLVFKAYGSIAKSF